MRFECWKLFVGRRIPAVVNRFARDLFEAAFRIDRGAPALARRGMFTIDSSERHGANISQRHRTSKVAARLRGAGSRPHSERAPLTQLMRFRQYAELLGL